MPRKSTSFSVTIIRDDEEYELEGQAHSTGYNNRDVGGGGSDELDEAEIDDTFGLVLTDAEWALVDEAAQEALYDA